MYTQTETPTTYHGMTPNQQATNIMNTTDPTHTNVQGRGTHNQNTDAIDTLAAPQPTSATSLVHAMPIQIPYAITIPTRTEQETTRDALDQTCDTIMSDTMIDETCQMSDVDIAMLMNERRKTTGDKRKAAKISDADDETKQLVTQHGKLATRRKPTLRWKHHEQRAYIEWVRNTHTEETTNRNDTYRQTHEDETGIT